jgi:gas vesicle protein
MKTSHLLLAFLGGAVVGGVAALLLAPKSGKETREDIKNFVDDEMGQVKDFVGRNVAKAKSAVEKEREEAAEI